MTAVSLLYGTVDLYVLHRSMILRYNMASAGVVPIITHTPPCHFPQRTHTAWVTVHIEHSLCHCTYNNTYSLCHCSNRNVHTLSVTFLIEHILLRSLYIQNIVSITVPITTHTPYVTVPIGMYILSLSLFSQNLYFLGRISHKNTYSLSYLSHRTYTS